MSKRRGGLERSRNLTDADELQASNQEGHGESHGEHWPSERRCRGSSESLASKEGKRWDLNINSSLHHLPPKCHRTTKSKNSPYPNDLMLKGCRRAPDARTNYSWTFTANCPMCRPAHVRVLRKGRTTDDASVRRREFDAHRTQLCNPDLPLIGRSRALKRLLIRFSSVLLFELWGPGRTGSKSFCCTVVDTFRLRVVICQIPGGMVVEEEEEEEKPEGVWRFRFEGGLTRTRSL